MAIQVNYSSEVKENSVDSDDKAKVPPLIRIVSGLELSDTKQKGKKFLVIAYEPFENIAIELPPNEILFSENNDMDNNNDGVDELNKKCTFWDAISKLYYVQFFFKQAEQEQADV